MFKAIGNQKGSVLLVTIAVLVLLTFLGIAALHNSSTDVDIAGNYKTGTKTFYAADAAIGKGVSKLMKAYNDSNLVEVEPASVTLATHSDETYNATDSSYTFAIPGSKMVIRYRIRSGNWKRSGPYSIKEYYIQAAAMDSTSKEWQGLQQKVAVKRTTLFRFAMFFKDDLEILPGQNMTISGPVHTNKNLFLNAGANLNLNSIVTAAGYIFRGRKDQNTSGGNVYIKNTSGTDVALVDTRDAILPKIGFNNIDVSDPLKGNGASNPPSDPIDTWGVDPAWANYATSTWGGLVKDKALGVVEKTLPDVNSIDRGGFYEQKAGLRVITKSSGTIEVYDQNNNPISLASFPAGTFTNSNFYNGRELMTVKTTDIDIAKLTSSGYFPSNGLIYATREDAVKDANPNDNTPDVSRKPYGIRLVNGATLPAATTLASNNPVYVKGDFNRHTNTNPSLDSWKGCGIICDAVNLQSNSWSDASNTTSNLKAASNTEINAAFIGGIRNTFAQGATNYSGGAENYPRLLEDWSGRTLKWRGSFIELWQSAFATGNWTGTGTYYNAPTRDWGYDARFSDLSNFPPSFINMFPAVNEDIGTKGGWMKLEAASANTLVSALLAACGG